MDIWAFLKIIPKCPFRDPPNEFPEFLGSAFAWPYYPEFPEKGVLGSPNHVFQAKMMLLYPTCVRAIRMKVAERITDAAPLSCNVIVQFLAPCLATSMFPLTKAGLL